MPVSSSLRTTTRAVIFDLDGVLVWTIPMHWWAFKKTFETRGRDFSYEEYMREALGAPREEVIRRVLGDGLGPAEFEELIALKGNYVEEYLREKGVDMIPGALDFVQAVREHKVKTAVASASRTPRLLLESVGAADLFETIVDRGMVVNSKPHPDVFLSAAKKLGVTPAECIVIEDSAVGVEAAVRASMRVLALTTTHERNELAQAAAVYRRFADIPLEEWLGVG